MTYIFFTTRSQLLLSEFNGFLYLSLSNKFNKFLLLKMKEKSRIGIQYLNHQISSRSKRRGEIFFCLRLWGKKWGWRNNKKRDFSRWKRKSHLKVQWLRGCSKISLKIFATSGSKSLTLSIASSILPAWTAFRISILSCMDDKSTDGDKPVSKAKFSAASLYPSMTR